jgi:multidrug efflux system membrane fusion protein
LDVPSVSSLLVVFFRTGRVPRKVVVASGALLVVLAALSACGASKSGAAVEPRGARAVPVLPATVVRRDVPVYLEGIGSVVAYKTVTVRSQVDGRLIQVLFREGQAVRKGEVLAQIDARPFQVQLHQAEGALARDRAQLENANLVVKRDRALVGQKLIAQQQLDTDQALAGQTEGTVRIDQAAIESARLNLDYARITSPVNGVTGVRLVDPGNVVHAADLGGIVVVTQLDPVAVLFNLPQDELPRISDQMAHGKLGVEVYGRDGATALGKGELELIDNQINQATSTLRLKAIVPNPEHHLWPNQFVKARLLLSTHKGALVVPASTLQRGPDGTFVYVIGTDQTVTVRPVEAVSPTGDLAIIDKGVSEGEIVVADGQNQLRPGSKVSVRESGKEGGGRGGGGKKR